MRRILALAVVVCIAASATAAWVHLRTKHLGGILPKVYAQEQEEGCSLATLNGSYGLTFHGFTTTSAIPAPINAFAPVAGGGIVTFDGEGNLSSSETVSLGGQILSGTFPGTYTVNSNCTGSLTINFGPGSAGHLNFVIVRNGREILAVSTDPGNVAVDDLEKQ